MDYDLLITDTKKLIALNIDFLQNVDTNQYSLQSKNQSSIGTHYRHALDFYKNILNACLSNEPVCYENRERDSQIETDKSAAITYLKQIAQVITMYPMTKKLELATPYGIIKTSLDHEIIKANSHLVHHNALSRKLADRQGIDTPQYYGFDQVTINHLNKK